MHARRGSAFTLIELMVVISVIAVLIGLLLPTLGSSRQVAKAMQCMSNIRQIEIAHYSFMMDNNGTLIDAGLAHGGLDADEDEAWIKTLEEYWSSTQDSGHGIEVKARSPLDNSPHWGPAPAGAPIDGAPTDQRRRTSYGLNDYLTTVAPTAAQRHRNLDRIRRPATTVHVQIMAFEGEYAGADHAHNTGWYGGGPPPHARASEQVQTNAVRGDAGSADAVSNWGFLDGHVEQVAFSELGDDENSNKFNPAVGP